nr:unnamed protein product [Spirometra erinaceieuropaei]
MLSACDGKPKILSADVNERDISEFLYIVCQAYSAYKDPEDMCTAIKQRLDEQFGKPWHVVVGQPFGGHFDHDPGCYAYIQYRELSFLMFRFG